MYYIDVAPLRLLLYVTHAYYLTDGIAVSKDVHCFHIKFICLKTAQIFYFSAADIAILQDKTLTIQYSMIYIQIIHIRRLHTKGLGILSQNF